MEPTRSGVGLPRSHPLLTALDREADNTESCDKVVVQVHRAQQRLERKLRRLGRLNVLFRILLEGWRRGKRENTREI